MNRYIMIRRLRGPAILLLIGALALLHQTGAIPHFWRLLWPLLLITWGVLLLAERAALAAEGYPIVPCAPWHDPVQSAPTGTSSPAATTSTAIVPSHWEELKNDKEGGQS
jgi:hypothetical protein